MSGQTLRVGLVGAGLIGHHHGLAWKNNAPRGEIVAIADISRERAEHLNAEHCGNRAVVVSNIAELLSTADVDAVDICLPHDLHTEAIVLAANAGKAILCEKPLCTNLADAITIRDALQATGVTLMMAHNQLFQPSLIEARRLIASGVMGRVFAIRSTESMQNRGFATGRVPFAFRNGESPWAWRSDPARMGGGEVLDTGWHATYRLLALAGERPVEVAAMTDRFAVKQLAVEDTGALLVRFESGAIGQILTSWAFSLVGDWHFDVAAELGSLTGGSTRLVHQFHGWADPAEQVNAPVHTMTAEVTHFLDVVQYGEPCLATFDHAARVLQLTLAAYQAAAEHSVVQLAADPLTLSAAVVA